MSFPYDSGANGSFEAFGTMGTPNHANEETINRISVEGGTWTVNQDGFVRAGFEIQGTARAAPYWIGIRVNGKYADAIWVNNGTPNRRHTVIPVKKGDLVSIEASSTISDIVFCYFIPPINNKGSFATSVYMTY